MKKIATALLVAALLPLPLQAQDTAENLVAGMRKAEMTYKECWRRLNLDPDLSDCQLSVGDNNRKAGSVLWCQGG